VTSWRFKFSDILSILARFKSKPPIVDRPPAPEPESPAFKIAWVDMREHKRTKSRGRSKGQRSWQDVLGVTLHQTAVVIGSPDRCLNMPVHGAVLDDGEGGAIVVLLHDPTALLWHGHGFNTHDIGIEIACRACGIEGELAKGTEATDAQLEGARLLLRYYDDLVQENGGQIQFIHAHRQATKNRVGDPGSRIWAAVGEWAASALCWSVGPADFQISHGKPLPDAWTGRANGIEYDWRVDGRLDPG